ncbi:hypothetical protein [Aquibaculum arenosum]|uniref:Uncharacterized protein n=1 Tax=Aquibaculum arenosum TaxID=3032591 RepID=A0ABT5YJV5_9PROT|nr:hypothetical protein [Fodinicurvata sp. CAU 1616]MDF2095133.1 hypothetical protein [Fodinicurvata sp. CAU 1616]
MRTFLIIAFLGAFLLGALFIGVKAWSGLAGVDMPWQGWLALIGGSVLTLALGIGLMALMFYSARHGHDDTHHEQGVHREPDPHQPGAPDAPGAPEDAADDRGSSESRGSHR